MRCLFALLALCLLVPAAFAAGITITAEQKDYYFALGEPADIPLTISNTYTHAIDGTIQFTTIEQMQNANSVLMSTKNRVDTRTFEPGNSVMEVGAETSKVPRIIRGQIVYYYSDPSPVTVSLPEITIHFVDTKPSSGAAQSPVSSTSSPGGNAPAGSSIQLVQQAASAQQQAGRDGSMQPSIQNSQIPQDAAALKEQLKKEAERKEQEKNQFNALLENDTLVRAVNSSLADEGFFRESLDTSPAGGDAGTFSMEYRNTAGEQVSLGGAMEEGSVPSVTERSGSPVRVSPTLNANATYLSSADHLREQGFLRNGTVMEISRGGTIVNLTYQNGQGRRATVNATITGGNVTSLDVGVEKEPAPDYLPAILIAIIAALVGVAGLLVYRRYCRQRDLGQRVPQPDGSGAGPFDHRAEAERLLKGAENAFCHHRYAEAYGMAGQALRLYLSYESGIRTETTNDEILAYIRSSHRDIAELETILRLCEMVEFARGEPDQEEFTGIIAKVRTLIKN